MRQLHKTDQYISPVLCLVRKLRHGQEGEGHDLLWRGWVQTGILTSALAQEGARTDWNPRGWPDWAANRVTWGMRRMHCSNRVWGEPHLHIYPAAATATHLPNCPTTLSRSCWKTAVCSCLWEWLMLWSCTCRPGLINVFEWWWLSNASPNFNEFADRISFYLSLSPQGLMLCSFSENVFCLRSVLWSWLTTYLACHLGNLGFFKIVLSLIKTWVLNKIPSANYQSWSHYWKGQLVEDSKAELSVLIWSGQLCTQ